MPQNNPFLNTLGNIFKGAGNFIAQDIQRSQPAQFINNISRIAKAPPVQNFIQKNPISQAITSQIGFGPFNNPRAQLPQIPTFKPTTFKNPFINTIANIGISIPNEFTSALNASNKTQSITNDLVLGKKKPQQLIGNVAQQLLPATYFMGGGQVKAAGKAAFNNPSLKNVFMEGINHIIPTAKLVGSYTALHGLSANQDKSINNQFMDTAKDTISSLPLSVPAAFIGPAAGYGFNKLSPVFKKAINAATKSRITESAAKIAKENPPGPHPWESNIFNRSSEKFNLTPKEKLKSLLTYQSDLRRLGYTQKEINKISAEEGRNLINLALPPKRVYGSPTSKETRSIKDFETNVLGRTKPSKFNEIFNPLKNQEKDIQEAFINLDRAHKISQVDANKVATEFSTNIDPKTQWKLVMYSEKPTAKFAKELGLTAKDLTDNADFLKHHRKFNDEIYQEIKDAGVGWHYDEQSKQMKDIGYLSDHIYQMWKQSPEEIEQIGRGLAKSPGNAYKRWIPTFKEGIEKGLTPRYTTFSQLNAGMVHSYKKAVANKNFVEKLLKSGRLAPENEAPQSWELITAPYFPKASTRIGIDDSISVSYKAPRELAQMINNYFGGQTMSTGDKILHGAAQASSTAQQSVLSGGVGPLNFFGLGQMVKEATAGRVTTPLRAFMRAYVPGASHAYEKANYKFIREMAEEGISIRGVGNYQKIYKNVASSRSIREVVGEGWHQIFDVPTFFKFLTQLQVGFYKDTRQSLIKKGMSEQLAVRTAADATKKFYGINETLGRSGSVDDILSTVFLAPRYRQAMVQVFYEMGKSFKPGNIGKAEYAGLQKLSIGMSLTYGLYNLAQKQLTGKFMWDNPAGKEFELVIPVGDPKDKKFMSVPFMPGFTAVPRRIAGAAAATIKGDFKEATGQLGGLTSIPLSKVLDLVRNKDYFGNEIIGEENQLKDLGIYAATSLMPGYGRAAVNYATGKATGAFAIAQGLELPIRKGSFPNEYFSAKDEALKGLNPEEKKLAEYFLTPDYKGGPDSNTEAKMMFDSPKLFEIKKNIALATNPNDPLWSRSDDDIRSFLAYRMLDDDGGTDTQIKAQIAMQKPWIPMVQYQNSQAMYDSQQQQITPSAGYDPNSVQGKLGALFNPAKQVDTSKFIEQPLISPKQQLTEQQVAIASAYTALPKGSFGRKQLLAQNPWLKTYWDANSAYYEANPIVQKGPMVDFLASMGIDINIDSNLAYSPYGKKRKKGKKIAVKKIKLKGIKFGKGKKRDLKIKPIDTSFASIVDGVQKKKKQSKQFDYLVG